LYDLVEVIWEDIVAHSGWTQSKDFNQDVATIQTIGWLSRETSKAFTVSASFGTDGEIIEYNQHITIPKGCIVSIKKLDISKSPA
jgi:hypothetical protein